MGDHVSPDSTMFHGGGNSAADQLEKKLIDLFFDEEDPSKCATCRDYLAKLKETLDGYEIGLR